MTRRRAFVDARLLDPASGTDTHGGVIVEGETIVAAGAEVSRPNVGGDCEIVECDGLCLSPGLVDMRVQFREPGEEHKETIDSASRAAAAGGVTALVGLPNTSPVIDDVAVAEFVARRAREVKLVKVFVYGAATRGLAGEQLSEMGLLLEAGVLGFTDGEKAIANARVLRRALTYARTFDALVLQHPEEPSLARDGVMTEGEIATRLGLRGIPAMAEAMMIERDLRLVEMTGGRYHAAHVSTAEALELLRRAKRRGLRVTCDTAPHYFALNENAVGDYRTFGKVSPPLRSEFDRQAVVAALVDGTIDVIASDHAPHDQESKRVPFAQADFGIVGIETLLPLTLELYHKGDLTLLGAIGKLTQAPADLLGLPMGRLAPGAPADLLVFDPDRPWRIDTSAFRCKSRNSPFDGRPVQGRVVRTVVDGRTIWHPDGPPRDG